MLPYKGHVIYTVTCDRCGDQMAFPFDFDEITIEHEHEEQSPWRYAFDTLKEHEIYERAFITTKDDTYVKFHIVDKVAIPYTEVEGRTRRLCRNCADAYLKIREKYKEAKRSVDLERTRELKDQKFI